MDQKQLQYFKQKLLKERASREDSVFNLEENGLSLSFAGAISELSTYDQHPGDVGTEMFERSKDIALRGATCSEIKAIDDALLRVDNGKYGYCETCGNEIDKERLEAIPFTTVCKVCKEEEESQFTGKARPVEEDVLEPPFARTFNDGTGDVMFDGEDSWQAVARWQEDAPMSGAGSYYGPLDMDNEHIGVVERVEGIPCQVGEDGVIYEEFKE